ncbi:MAG: transcription elongation factor GreA [Candidatus Nanopelagicales bacterium]
MTDTTYLSQEAHDRLAEELAQRSGPVRKEISAKIAAARAEGDLKENGGYHAAREDYAHNDARIKQLEHLLDSAVIGVAPEAAEGKATQGTLVSIRYPGDDDAETYLLASREEAKHTDDVQVISPASPLGSALMGCQEGDEATYTLPNGKQLTVEVVSVEVYGG